MPHFLNIMTWDDGPENNKITRFVSHEKGWDWKIVSRRRLFFFVPKVFVGYNPKITMVM